MKKAQQITALIAIILVSLVATSTVASETVSPGALDRLSVVETRCPTFSWGFDNEAMEFELVVYELHEGTGGEVEFTLENEVLYVRVPGSATGWTPSAEQCCATGGRFVWFIRSVTEMIDDQIIAAGDWSAGRYFQVPVGLSDADVARAIEVLKQWETANGGGSLMLSSGTGTGTGTGTGSNHRKGEGVGEGEEVGHRKSVQTASAAIRGENPETSMEAYGVVGTSASVDGAGLAAANTVGGPDLVLDGSYDGVPGAELSEWGLDRPGPTDQTFTFRNSDAGSLHLVVAGDISGHTVDFQELKISGSTVIDNSGEWIGSGDMLPCVDCVTAAEIANGSVATVDLADNSVTGAKIASGAIGTSEINHDSVNSVHIIDGAVDSDDLANGSVTVPKLAVGAVSAAAIRNNAVANNHLADDAVTSAEILDGSVTTDDLADGSVSYRDLASGSVRSGQIFDGSVISNDLADGAILTAKIGDFSVTGTKIGPSAITGTHLADGAVHATDIAPSSITTGHIVDGTIGSADVATSSITGNHIVNDTITAADVDSTGGIYSSRSAIYSRLNSIDLPAGTRNYVAASCADLNDLPLTGSCSRGVDAWDADCVVNEFYPSNWGSSSCPASFVCTYHNRGPTTETVQSGITCLAVAGLGE